MSGAAGAPGATATCEYVVNYDAFGPVFCDRVAVARYPAAGGGHMHVCLTHAKPHRAYAEPCYAGECA